MKLGTVSAAAAAIALIAMHGFATDDTDRTDAPSGLAFTDVGSGPCPDVICGMNSPVIDSFRFHELNLDGAPNAEGYRIWTASRGVAQIYQDGSWYDLQVSGNHISGVHGDDVLAAADVKNAQIPIVRDGVQYVLRISAVGELPFFVGARGTVGGYQLAWATGAIGSTGAFAKLCTGGSEDSRNTPGSAVAFEGDRVDARAIAMDRAADDRWFNVGCVGHALSKLLLTRNTVHTQDPALAPVEAWRHRQATLKMLAADYCGTGTAFTTDGQRLAWQGDAMTYHGSHPAELEARWDEHGATCVGTPRLMHPTTPLGAVAFTATYRDVEDAIAQLCVGPGAHHAPPHCSDGNASVFDGALRVSANP